MHQRVQNKQRLVVSDVFLRLRRQDEGHVELGGRIGHVALPKVGQCWSRGFYGRARA